MAVLLAGCERMRIEQFVGGQPELRLEEFFAGAIRAYGLFEDRFGNVRRQFIVDIEGHWDGQELVLDEHFVFSDGERSRRVWRMRKMTANAWEGRADDVIGVATGRVAGNALNFRYTIDLDIGSRKLRAQFNDWLFLQPDGVLINRAHVTWWGIEIGQVTLTFRRQEQRAAARLPTGLAA
jgi:hypothetical protein